jgi:HAD superfamily phosphatase
MRDSPKRVQAEKGPVELLLEELGVECSASSSGVVVSGPRVPWLREGLAAVGVTVKADGKKKSAARIAVPDDPAALAHLLRGIRSVLKPDAVLLDVDGVLVDVSRSYRRAIVDTATYFGATVVAEAVKVRGNTADDLATTIALLEEQGQKAKPKAVATEFERRYQGGLWRHETLRFKPDELRTLADRYPLALVTHRTRKDLYRLLEYHGLLPLFQAVVVKEDGPAKPDPWPVLEALTRLDVRSAWMLGDGEEDVASARGAAVVPIGVPAAGDPDGAGVLQAAGAARVVGAPAELLDLLP